MAKAGQLYVRIHEAYDLYDACKLGITQNITNRETTYITGEIRRGEFSHVFEVPLEKLLRAELWLRYDFKNFNVYIDGGTEFYKKSIIPLIIEQLKKRNIEARQLSLEEIESIKRKEYISQRKKHLANLIAKQLKETIPRPLPHCLQNNLRNELQASYEEPINNALITYNRATIKAPTGFGKTHLYYKAIVKCNSARVLFLTPRLMLNHQIVEEKYSFYIKHGNYEIIHYSDIESKDKEKIIKKLLISNERFIMTSCYQSQNSLLKIIRQIDIVFDLIIFDEAHFITSWINPENMSEFLTNNNITKYRLFGSATLPECIEITPVIFGPVIEKVKVYELINQELLCNIETIVKQLENKKREYHNLKELIVESMIKYNKKKGIIYVNDCKNAENLYKLFQKQDKLNVYIYISKEIEVENSHDTCIKIFEQDKKQCVIICVGKIGYGYDNDYIDFICLGDPRQSDIDIRQIIGRGLRWKKEVYPNKLLHLLIPLYKDEFDNYSKNEHLKKYLDYIIGECGKDIIFKNNGIVVVGNKKEGPRDGTSYDGANIPTEILNEYCTTGYNKYTDFLRFLKSNLIYDEISYNKLKEKQNWIVELGGIQTKYPKFCFRHIHPKNMVYYWDKKEALGAYELMNNKLADTIGKEKYRKYTSQQKLEKINELDKKIPPIKFELYYPTD
jgi:superfamily II DNA or RNA helicase|uniref:Helicase ATP-binding domain-containing protein n=1 Tax=viral metagenome TaxID=1070528 RepID=A0A6C0CBA7_9ZZZZ